MEWQPYFASYISFRLWVNAAISRKEARAKFENDFRQKKSREI
jgi:hypothetical protein